MPNPPEGQVEVVRGRATPAINQEILRFWAAEAAFEGPAAEERLAQVVCVLRDADGAIAGVNSVFAADVPLVGGRPFWIYRTLLPERSRAAGPALIRAAYDALNAEFDMPSGGPIGLCVAVDADELRARPDAVWRDPTLFYAGYVDGQQVRIAYFPQARIGGPGPPAVVFTGSLDIPYRMELFEEQDLFDEEDVIDLWLQYEALTAQEAHRRRSELHMVGSKDGELVALTTRYLQHNDQLGMDFWYGRTFVVPAHRSSLVASAMGTIGTEIVTQQYVDGTDRRAAGIIAEVDNEHVKKVYDYAEWHPSEYYFVGVNDRGSHVMVHYFPGVAAPLPE